MKNLKTDGSRLWQSLMDMAEIGATPKGGSRREALTDEDKEGRDLFVRWCEEAGCTVTVDAMGNIFARRPGRNNDADPVVTGSHLDTQPHGGKFDGVYGVLAGLEVIRTLNDLEIETEVPVEVSVWTNEEGSRFAPSMIGSGVYGGAYDIEYAHSREDTDGKTQGGELERIGYLGDLPCGGRAFKAFIEAHIEQGPILEDEGRTIGIVTGAQGLKWYDVTVTGRDSHAGTTPMPARRDAMAGAAEMITAITDVALANPPHAVATIGEMRVEPNSRNTIAGEIFFTIDLRCPDGELLDRMAAEIEKTCQSIAESRELSVELDRIANQTPFVFDEATIAAVRDATERNGFSSREMISGAGHDACYLSNVAPVAMIFVPCEDGLSHNEAENATPEDLAAGCDVLLHAMLDVAGTART